MNESFDHLLSPYKLGSIVLPNRIVNLPHGTLMVEDGVPLELNLDHYRRLAAGGSGLFITGGTTVHPSGTMRRRFLIEAFNPKALEALSKHVDVVKENGASIVGQLLHLGRDAVGAESTYAFPAPSPMTSPREPYAPHELHPDEISELVTAFGQAAANFESIGFDGIELHAAHGYLISQFLSPLTNNRSDAYGGSPEGRIRFLEEILREVRQRCSPTFIVGVRISATEDVPGGLDADESCAIAKHISEMVEEVNYFNVTIGVRGGYIRDATVEDGLVAPMAERIKKATGVTTLVTQRIRDPYMADQIVRQGQADLVGMVRAMLADPEWARKTIEGRTGEIRMCIGVNQDCRAMDPHTYCAVNPEIGRPLTFAMPTSRVKEAKTVWVVGGGPAGLEAAYRLLKRGHRVRIFEREHELGGQVTVASRAPGRSKLFDLVDFQTREVRRMGGEIHLGAEVSAGELLDAISEGVDAVVVATGSTPKQPDFGASFPVVTIDDLLLGRVDIRSGSSAVVFDSGDGFWPAFNVVEALAAKGARVSFVTPLAAVGARIPHESITGLMSRMVDKGVRLIPHHNLGSVADGHITVQSTLGPEEVDLELDLLVWYGGRKADDDLWRNVRSTPSVSVIGAGDCLAPRRIGHAVYDGYEAAKSIDLASRQASPV